jgi:hypothetical protein
MVNSSNCSCSISSLKYLATSTIFSFKALYSILLLSKIPDRYIKITTLIEHNRRYKQMVIQFQPIVALIAGILILLIPRLLNYIVAIYLIVVGISGLARF